MSYVINLLQWCKGREKAEVSHHIKLLNGHEKSTGHDKYIYCKLITTFKFSGYLVLNGKRDSIMDRRKIIYRLNYQLV